MASAFASKAERSMGTERSGARMGLQKRISLALTAVITLFVAAQGYLAYASLEEQEDQLVDEIVNSETRRLVERIESRDVTWLPEDQPLRLGPSLTAWLIPADGPALVPPPGYLAALSNGPHMLYRDDRVYHAIIEPIPQGRLFVQYDATLNEAFVYRFGRYLLLSGLLCILVGGLMSSFLARVVVAPFRRMSERLKNWSPGGLTESSSRSDEETMLLQAFDQAQRRLEESLIREREFAANVRHEVRTPLAALRTDAEMILLVESLTAASEQRLHRMVAAVDSISSGLDALHELSSASQGGNEEVFLAQCVEDVWQSLAHIASSQGASLANEIPEADSVIVDRLALVTILRNLLRNAIEHASPGTCRVWRIEHGLAVGDEGPGIPVADRPFVFDRYFQGRLKDSPGVAMRDKGLGLAIARQTADLHGWVLGLDASGSGGAMFTLEFGARGK